jgi:hypothetical protein
MEMRVTLWRQLGATIAMVENAIRACPDALWQDQDRFPQYWAMVYHVLFFLEYYHADSQEDFRPPEPFSLCELDPRGVLPERVYTKDEMLGYAEHCRKRLRHVVETVDLDAPRTFGRFESTNLEGLLHTTRHVQHHAAQLNLMLRQVTCEDAPRWVGAASV